MSDAVANAQFGERQRAMWQAVKRYQHDHPEQTNVQAFAALAEQLGKTASAIANAYYSTERINAGRPYRSAASRQQAAARATGPEVVATNGKSAARVPSPVRSHINAMRKQATLVERAVQAFIQTLDELEDAIRAEAKATEADRARLARVDAAMEQLSALMPAGTFPGT